jgi:hypothetical protein
MDMILLSAVNLIIVTLSLSLLFLFHLSLLHFQFFSISPRLFSSFTAGDVSWGEMHPVVALCLGFRVKDGTVRQDDTVEPQGD